jgi:MoxR-like ATPase
MSLAKQGKGMNMQEPIEQQEQELERLLAKLGQVADEVGKVIVGQHAVVEQLMIGLLSGGHCLLEGVPGLAKTLMVKTLADSMHLSFRRIQFTPDLMPSDLIGTEILQADDEGRKRFEFQPGPVFTQVLLADEINRTPPKTQAALLEAMQEHTVSFAGETRALPEPYFVLATQNPLEQAGTYPLPEAQLDRFLMFIVVDYPDDQEELEILRRTTGNIQADVHRLLEADEVLALQNWVRQVTVSEALLEYAARVVRATRPDDSGIAQVREYVRWGAGPRAGQSLILAAKGRALMDGRFSIREQDLRRSAHSVLRHRLLLNFHAQADAVTADDIIDTVLREVEAPQSPLEP